jgi:signal transduction histidine kinase
MNLAPKPSSEPAPAVLIVEDERVFAMDLQEMLRDCGYDPFAIASSADDALARMQERRPDLVMMDIRIKGSRDGVETASLLRQRYDVPIIFVTAHADDGTLSRIKDSGAYGYLVKPIRSSELRGAVEVSLGRHRSERALRERLELVDRLATVGRLATGFAQALNSPLSAASAHVDFIGSEVDALSQQLMAAGAASPARLESLSALKESQLELGRALGSLRLIVADLQHLRGDADEAEQADLRSAIEWVGRVVAPELRARARFVSPPVPALPALRLSPARLRQLLLNLLLNAAHSIEPGAAHAHEVRLEARLLEPHWVELEVADTGQGVPAPLRERVFEPFFSTWPPGAALGLGLAIARDIVAASGGELACESRAGGGSVFRARLPVSEHGA